MNHLNQEVSSLTKELHEMMQFLHSHVTPSHFASSFTPFSSYNCHTSSSFTNVASSTADWSSRLGYNMSAGACLQPETSQRDSLGSRHTCACGESHAQERGSVLGQEGDIEHLHQTHSTYTHFPCCPDQERVATLGVESQTSKTTPNSPYTRHQGPRTGGSLLGLASAFPASGLVPQVRSGGATVTPSNTLPLCTYSIQSPSHPSVSLQMTSDITCQHSRAPTPIHSSVTPTGPSQPLIAVSSLMHAGICSTNLLHFPTGPRQNDLVGSSPVHTHDPILASSGEKEKQEHGPEWRSFEMHVQCYQSLCLLHGYCLRSAFAVLFIYWIYCSGKHGGLRVLCFDQRYCFKINQNSTITVELVWMSHYPCLYLGEACNLFPMLVLCCSAGLGFTLAISLCRFCTLSLRTESCITKCQNFQALLSRCIFFSEPDFQALS